MFRIVLLILALALYGAHALMTGSAVNPGSPSPAAIEQGGSTTDATSGATSPGLIAGLASTFLGISFLPLPAEGCTDGALPPERVEALVESLPPQSQVALAKVLNASSTVWSAELYAGPLGTGLCLPGQNEMVLFPQAATNTTNSLVNMAGSFLVGSTQ
jgi:hypothetical protein